jgi:hypothetical protein
MLRSVSRIHFRLSKDLECCNELDRSHCYRRPASIQTAAFARRPDADFELDFNGAAALSDKLLNLAETKTRTLPNRLHREIGVERLAKYFVCHAASVIGDDFYHSSRRSWTRHTAFRKDRDMATVLRRCTRIAARIEEREAKVLWIGHKLGGILNNIGVK